jgi:hypothetical protein
VAKKTKLRKLTRTDTEQQKAASKLSQTMAQLEYYREELSATRVEDECATTATRSLAILPSMSCAHLLVAILYLAESGLAVTGDVCAGLTTRLEGNHRHFRAIVQGYHKGFQMLVVLASSIAH